MSIHTTDLAQIEHIVGQLRKGFQTHVTQKIQWRLEQLQNLQTMLTIPENREALCVAMYKDLGRSRFEAGMYEIDIALTEIAHFIHLLKTDPEYDIQHVGTNLLNAPATSYIRNDPYGVVLVASPWNYPILLCLQPLAGALACGNTVLVRPGTYSQHTSNTILNLIQKSFDPAFVNCVIGERDVTTEVLKNKFDLFCFTGGSSLGKVYHRAANEHLAPCLLELGGSNPTIIWKDAPPAVTARRLVSTAFMNFGQTCVRPQIFFAHEAVLPQLVSEMKQCINNFYQIGNDFNEYRIQDCYKRYLDKKNQHKSKSILSIADWVQKQDNKAKENAKLNQSLNIKDPKYKSNFKYMQRSPWLGRAINQDAYKRLVNLIEQDREFIVFGGEYNQEELFISPTIMVFNDIRDFNNAKSVLNGEIFGPIVTILAINDRPNVSPPGRGSNKDNHHNYHRNNSLSGVIDWINQHDKPLSLYLYTFDSNIQQEVVENTSSGSLVINDSVLQLSNPNLPFGGVGLSGMGAYHGKHSLQSFSHQKAILSKGKFNMNYADAPLRYPPYTTNGQSIMSTLAGLEQYDLTSAKWFISGPILAAAVYGAYSALPFALPYLQTGLDFLKDLCAKQ